jgi:hypothetical protein
METQSWVELEEPLFRFRFIDKASKLQVLKRKIQKAYKVVKDLDRSDQERIIGFIARTVDPEILLHVPLSSSSPALFNRLAEEPSLGYAKDLIDSLDLDINDMWNKAGV